MGGAMGTKPPGSPSCRPRVPPGAGGGQRRGVEGEEPSWGCTGIIYMFGYRARIWPPSGLGIGLWGWLDLRSTQFVKPDPSGRVLSQVLLETGRKSTEIEIL